MSFLKAEWRKLILANYVVDPNLLEPYVPFGTELDLWENKCYLSLVGFMFKNTRLLGIKIPFHVNFEEVNLRFYVKRKVGNEWKRGVVFIKEIVPKPALTFVANTIYDENYETMRMRHTWEDLDHSKRIAYEWKTDTIWNKLEVITDKSKSPILPGSEAEFITEHYWGYAAVTAQKTNEYEVTHPRWQQYVVREVNIEADFQRTYGDKFSFLNQSSPASVIVAEGSEITVEAKKVIKP